MGLYGTVACVGKLRELALGLGTRLLAIRCATASPRGACACLLQQNIGHVCILPAAAARQYAIHAAAASGGRIRCGTRQKASHEQRAASAAGH